MGYSGVKGGVDAILAAERLVRRKRAEAPQAPASEIIASFRLAVDRIMSEAGLYDEVIAADAFRQSEGDLMEAAHLVRAYRSSLPRLAVTEPADPGEMTVLRRIVAGTTGARPATDTREATVIQTRHRIPEEALTDGHVLVFQVPVAEPLRGVQKSVAECDRMHAEADYSAIWVSLYEDIVRNGFITRSTGYPVLVNGRYVMATSPVPRWDVPRLDHGGTSTCTAPAASGGSTRCPRTPTSSR